MSDSGSWLIVEWGDDKSRDVVNTCSYEINDQDLIVSDEINFKKGNGESRRGKLIAVSDNRKDLEKELKKPLKTLKDVETEITNQPRSGTPSMGKPKRKSLNKEASASSRKLNTTNGHSAVKPKIQTYMKAFPKGTFRKIHPLPHRSNENESEAPSASISEKTQNQEKPNGSELATSSPHCLKMKKNLKTPKILRPVTASGSNSGSPYRYRSESPNMNEPVANGIKSVTENNKSPQMQNKTASKMNGTLKRLRTYSSRSAVSRRKPQKATYSETPKARKEPNMNRLDTQNEQELDDNADPESGEDFSPSGSSWAPEEQDASDSDIEEVVPKKKSKLGLINPFSNARNRIPSLRAKAIIPHQKSRENNKSKNSTESRQAAVCTKCLSQRNALKNSQLRPIMKIQNLMNKSVNIFKTLTRFMERFNDVLELTELMDAEDLRKYLVAGILSVHSENGISPAEFVQEQNESSLSHKPIVDNDIDYNMEIIDVEDADNLTHSQQMSTNEPVIDLRTVNENTKTQPETPDHPTTPNLPAAAPATNTSELETNEAILEKNAENISPKSNKNLVKSKSLKLSAHKKPQCLRPRLSTSFVDEEEFEGAAMIAIGCGKTLVNKSLFESVDWSSYTLATRKLLTAVFTREVLGSHSLTGKKSSAFPDKPAKLSLDPRKVNDIVMTVAEKCKVKANLVRSAITVKCADENKRARALRNTGILKPVTNNNNK